MSAPFPPSRLAAAAADLQRVRAPASPRDVENALIARAWQALTDMRELLGPPPDDIPYVRPSDVGPFDTDDQATGEDDADLRLRAEPAESAIHCCLSSASALLAITASLVNRGAYPSEQERARELKALAELGKTAGRSAYRAALILVDEVPFEAGR